MVCSADHPLCLTHDIEDLGERYSGTMDDLDTNRICDILSGMEVIILHQPIMDLSSLSRSRSDVKTDIRGRHLHSAGESNGRTGTSLSKWGHHERSAQLGLVLSEEVISCHTSCQKGIHHYSKEDRSRAVGSQWGQLRWCLSDHVHDVTCERCEEMSRCRCT